MLTLKGYGSSQSCVVGLPSFEHCTARHTPKRVSALSTGIRSAGVFLFVRSTLDLDMAPTSMCGRCVGVPHAVYMRSEAMV